MMKKFTDAQGKKMWSYDLTARKYKGCEQTAFNRQELKEYFSHEPFLRILLETNYNQPKDDQENYDSWTGSKHLIYLTGRKWNGMKWKYFDKIEMIPKKL